MKPARIPLVMKRTLADQVRDVLLVLCEDPDLDEAQGVALASIARTAPDAVLLKLRRMIR